MKNNKKIYSDEEFDAWAYRKELIIPEQFLIKEYLNKDGKTLEAGTAGGRILLEMEKIGFKSLYGFDYVEEFIEVAKKRDASKSINFEVQDASSMSYEDASFDQLIYLQQILCFITDEDKRLRAIEEAFRVLRPGGVALFSFLSYEARNKNFTYKLIQWYLEIIRFVLRKKISIQYLPWLILEGKLNFKALFDLEPYNYWYKYREVIEVLKKAGFKIKAVSCTNQIKEGVKLEESLDEHNITGMLYVVCFK